MMSVLTLALAEVENQPVPGSVCERVTPNHSEVTGNAPF